MQTFKKQPHEALDYIFNYVDWLGDDFITNADVSIDGSDSDLVLDTYAFDEEKVTVWLSQGSDGGKYKVTCRASTHLGRIKEQEFMLKVKEV